jgi:hypothetical protein
MPKATREEQILYNTEKVTADTPPRKSLVGKLAEVMGSVGWIEKTGYNEFHRYKYSQEADLVNAIRGELSKRSVMVFPDVVDVQRKPLEVESSKGIRKTQITEIAVKWTFVDGESGEERSIVIHGVGEDSVDKGFYKAFTGSEKYMLMKTFLIPTGDDPEKDSKEEAKEAAEKGKAAAKQVAEDKKAKYAQTHPESPETRPQLTMVQVGEDSFDVKGASETMNAHKEALLMFGKRIAGQKAVRMTGENLDKFKHVFCEERGGILVPLKAS